jgi:3-oxoacyl-[acyl-carrier protein] reductase
MRLAQRVVLVTGAAGGIGSAMVRAFAREGAKVAASDLNAAGLDGLVQGIKDGQVRAITADVTSSAECRRIVTETVVAFGRLDILVNCAGTAIVQPFLEHTEEAWHKTLALNLSGTFFTAQAAARVMAGQGGGRIINIASVSGLRGNYGRAAYGATKAGVINLTMVMANELGPLGINTNAIAPGPIDSPLVQREFDARQHAFYAQAIPVGRYGQPEEIADAAVFLASDAARFVNGHCLTVDGGFTAAGIKVR